MSYDDAWRVAAKAYYAALGIGVAGRPKPSAFDPRSIDEFVQFKASEPAIASQVGGACDPFWIAPIGKSKSAPKKIGRPADPMKAEIVRHMKELRSLPNRPTWKKMPGIIFHEFGKKYSEETLKDYYKRR